MTGSWFLDHLWLVPLLPFLGALLSTGPGGFVLPFEVISLVLVAALIGAITVAGRPTDVDRDEKQGER